MFYDLANIFAEYDGDEMEIEYHDKISHSI